MTLHRTGLAALLAGSLVAGCGAKEKGGATTAAPMHEVRMAMRGADENPTVAKRWTAYKARIGQATGLPVKIFQSSDYNGAIQAMASNQVDVAMLAGGGYANVDAQIGALAMPILTNRDAEGGIGYYSAVLVKAGSPYKTLQDLKGRSFGYVDFNSTSGYLYPRQMMREQGIDPDAYFGKTSFAGGHMQSVLALENGQFDGAVVEMRGGTPQTGFTTGAYFTLARRGLVHPGDFRTVWTAGPIPNAAIVVRSDRPQAFIDEVRGALATLPYDDPETWDEIGELAGSTLAAVNRDHYAPAIKLRAEELSHRRGGRS